MVQLGHALLHSHSHPHCPLALMSSSTTMSDAPLVVLILGTVHSYS
jgi:hypothetical protein